MKHTSRSQRGSLRRPVAGFMIALSLGACSEPAMRQVEDDYTALAARHGVAKGAITLLSAEPGEGDAAFVYMEISFRATCGEVRGFLLARQLEPCADPGEIIERKDSLTYERKDGGWTLLPPH